MARASRREELAKTVAVDEPEKAVDEAVADLDDHFPPVGQEHARKAVKLDSGRELSLDEVVRLHHPVLVGEPGIEVAKKSRPTTDKVSTDVYAKHVRVMKVQWDEQSFDHEPNRINTVREAIGLGLRATDKASFAGVVDEDPTSVVLRYEVKAIPAPALSPQDQALQPEVHLLAKDGPDADPINWRVAHPEAESRFEGVAKTLKDRAES